jgi:hypothetical protein
MRQAQSTALWTIVAAALLAVVVGIGVWVTRPRGSSRMPATLSAEEQAYLPQIAVSDVRMSAAQNFLGDTVTYLDAKVTNRGSRLVRRVDLKLEFVDALGQVVLRETAHAVAPASPALKPGETRPFRVTFEHMPAEWNQAPPAITVTAVQF